MMIAAQTAAAAQSLRGGPGFLRRAGRIERDFNLTSH